jgi:uncharacterized protein (TIGR00661 family)
LPDHLNILICPLDWGLGHATRCVPIIRQLLAFPCRVYIAGQGRSLDFLKTEFPDCQFINLPSYRFIYSRKGSMSLAMLLSSPHILYGILREHFALKKIIRQFGIHGLISDNRFGLWNKNIPCVYMTHQVRIKTNSSKSFLEPILFKVHKYFIRKYDFLWIPDFESEPSLAGELSHLFDDSIQPHYIGPLSRFTGSEKDHETNESDRVEILAIVSGPEPQRSIFEAMITEQAAMVQAKIILLRGIPGEKVEPIVKDNLTIYAHVESNRLKSLIEKAGIVLCRPGYSSIMDLAVMGKKAFFVPTPGQTEQEYLAKTFYRQGIANYSTQQSFDLNDVISKSSGFKGFSGFQQTGAVERALEQFVDYICSQK